MLLENAGRSLDDPAWAGASVSIADELLRPSVIYAPAIAALQHKVDVHAVAHITGGGIPGNLARVLPDDANAVVHRGQWEVPRIFEEIQRLGDIADGEMAKVFNLGIGMIVVVREGDRFKALDTLRAAGPGAVDLGEIVAGRGEVLLTD